MKTKLTLLCLSVMAMSGTGIAQTTMTGPSSSQSPYVVPVTQGGKSTSILTTGDSVNGYRMAGTPDGLGAFDNNNGTFTVTMNHEFGNTAGVIRAHGNTGSFVSKWIINKADLSVVSGEDLIQSVKLWDTANQFYDTYTLSNPMPVGFSRFCSADLPSIDAFYNTATGKGTLERIFMNGEESGSEGRAFGHILTGNLAGVSYELPRLGKASWENQVANPNTGDLTVVGGTDDATPGQVYFYIGTKQNFGDPIERAGLTNGNLWSIAVNGMLVETSTSVPPANTPFSMVNLGNVENMTGSQINTASNTAGVTQFLRPEDGAWDPRNAGDFYFVTTNSFTAPSRMWHVHFTDPTDFSLGGTITAVLDGTEGQKMMDNIGFDKLGNIVVQEDVGNNAHIGKMWNYNVDTDVFTQIFEHDSSRFYAGGANYLTQDEEASGAIDVSDILGAGMWLAVDQAHYSIPGELVEGGQFFAFLNTFTECASITSDVTLSGPSTICNGGSVTLTASQGSSYIWNTGATTRSISVNTPGAYYVTISGASGCSVNSDTVNIMSSSIPKPKIIAVNGQPFCSNEGVLLGLDSASNYAGYTFQWKMNLAPIPGATNNTYTATTDGDYTLTVSDASICTRTSNIKSLTIKPSPTSTVATPSTTVVCKGNTISLNATTVQSGYLYRWYLNDSTLVGVQSSVEARFNGNYTLVTVLNGCKDTSSAVAITINNAPSVTVTTNDPTTFCEGGAALLELAPSASGFTYAWRKGQDTISGANGDTYVVTEQGQYRALVTDANGCTGQSQPFMVTVDKTPPAVISANFNTTFVKLRTPQNALYTYQWYLNNSVIVGATNHNYFATANGDYTVQVTKGNCQSISTPFTVNSLRPAAASAQVLSGNFELNAYPNPVTNTLTIAVNGIDEVNGKIQLMDMTGKMLVEKTMNAATISIDMSSYANGMYMVRFSDNNGSTGTLRVTKQ